MTARADPLATVAAALARAEHAPPGDPSVRADLETALATVDEVRTRATTPFDVRRALAYRAELLDRLGRRAEAATAYAEALMLDLGNGEELLDGLRDLLDRFGALEAVLSLVPKAIAKHPGRRWQFTPLAEQAEKRLQLERTAALSPSDLERVRHEVARRLSSLPPCDHGDDRRPIARAVVAELGFDVPIVLKWLADLDACCCDCAVANVRGPREDRRA